MQTSNRFLDDLAKVANSAVSTLVGIKSEIEAMVSQRVERFLADRDLVPRDEFDAVKAVAATARAEQEKLERRVAALEARLGIKAKAAAKPAPKHAPKAKPAATAKRASKTRRKPRSG